MPLLKASIVPLAYAMTFVSTAYAADLLSLAASKSFKVAAVADGGAVCQPGRQVYSLIATAGPYNVAVPIVLLDDARKPVVTDEFVFARGFNSRQKDQCQRDDQPILRFLSIFFDRLR